jgi:hypothetical protein
MVRAQLNSAMCATCNEGRNCPGCLRSTRSMLIGPGLPATMCRLLLLGCCTLVVVRGAPTLREQENAAAKAQSELRVADGPPPHRRNCVNASNSQLRIASTSV